ncbi:G-protein coupled receptor 157-like [Littorina saxatilis]|uniref:G-protein coupled receptor 157-like n=1 Tax=Littorina saxatilis TaxID=31220 RepID=UPI0038B5C79F
MAVSTTSATTSSITESTFTQMSTMDIVYVTVTTVSSSLSVIGCIVIIGAHVAYRMLRTTGRAMLVQLSIADMLTALGNILGVLWDSAMLNRSKVYCSIQSAWTIFSSNASFFWTVAIALTLCWAIISNRPTTADRYWAIFMIVCWGVPALVTVIALSCDVLGYDPNLHQASWCWIDPEADNSLFWTFFTGKAWELSACLLTVVLYSAIKISLFRHRAKNKAIASNRKSRRDVIHEANVKLTFVPLVFIMLRIWGTVRFLIGFIDHQYASSSEAFWVVPLQPWAL